MANSVIAGIMIFIVIVVGALSFVMITSAFDQQTTAAQENMVDNPYLDNSSITSVRSLTAGFAESIPAAILMGVLLAVILIVLMVWSILKNGD